MKNSRLADRKLFYVESDGVSHLLEEVGDVLPGSVGVSGSLVLPCLDDGERVASDLLAEVTRNVPGTCLK